eukprot:7404192-Lingulodinium_polyedra.AAC.1
MEAGVNTGRLDNGFESLEHDVCGLSGPAFLDKLVLPDPSSLRHEVLALPSAICPAFSSLQ